MLELPIVQKKPKREKKPDWLRVKLPIGEDYKRVRRLVDEYKLHTICQSGNCPNMGECWGAGTDCWVTLRSSKHINSWPCNHLAIKSSPWAT